MPNHKSHDKPEAASDGVADKAPDGAPDGAPGETPNAAPPLTTLSTREIYANRWIRLREDSVRYADGTTGIYSVVEKPDFAVVAPLGEGRLHLVRQHRYPIGAAAWEFPQGTAPDAMTGGETPEPEALARAELAEETGLTAKRMERIGRIHPDNGLLTHSGEVFLATGLTAGPTAREPTEADMISAAFPVESVFEMIRAGEITDGPTLAAVALLLLHRRL